MNRGSWNRACALARNGGKLRPTLAHLVAAYRIVDERYPHAAIAALAIE